MNLNKWIMCEYGSHMKDIKTEEIRLTCNQRYSIMDENSILCEDCEYFGEKIKMNVVKVVISKHIKKKHKEYEQYLNDEILDDR